MSRRRESSSRVFVGNLPRDVKESEIDDLFHKYGHIRQINIRSSKNQGPSFAFIEFEDPRDANDAIKGRDGYDFDGYRIRVEVSNSSGEGRSRPRASPPPSSSARPRNPPKRSSYRIHVSNLPSSGSWQDLKDHMRQAGDVLFADVYKDGTAVVEFSRIEDMKRALETLQDSTFKSHDKETSVIHLQEDCIRSSKSRSQSRSSRSRSRSSRRSPSPSRRSRSRSASEKSHSKSRSRSPSRSRSASSVSRKRSDSRSNSR